MEKRLPHYHLEMVKDYVAVKGIDAFTLTARRNGFALGLTQAELIAVVLAITRQVRRGGSPCPPAHSLAGCLPCAFACRRYSLR